MGFVFGSFDDIGFGKGDKHIEGHWHLSVREKLRQGTSRKLLVFGGENSLHGPRENNTSLYDPDKMKLPCIAFFLFSILCMAFRHLPLENSVNFTRSPIQTTPKYSAQVINTYIGDII